MWPHSLLIVHKWQKNNAAHISKMNIKTVFFKCLGESKLVFCIQFSLYASGRFERRLTMKSEVCTCDQKTQPSVKTVCVQDNQ